MGARSIRDVVVVGRRHRRLVGRGRAQAAAAGPFGDASLPVRRPPMRSPTGSISTLPSIVEFHRDSASPMRTRSSAPAAAIRLGTSLRRLGRGPPPYVHAYGELRSAVRHRAPSINIGLRVRRSAPRLRRSTAIRRRRDGRALGRFVHPPSRRLARSATSGTGCTSIRRAIAEMMRAYALHLGVAETPAAIPDVRLRGEDGFDRSAAGSATAASSRPTCSSTAPVPMRSAQKPRSATNSRTGAHWLPCDRILFAEADPPAGTCRRSTRRVAVAGRLALASRGVGRKRPRRRWSIRRSV